MGFSIVSQKAVGRIAPIFLAAGTALSLGLLPRDVFSVQAVVLQAGSGSTGVAAPGSQPRALRAGLKLPAGSIVRCPAGEELFISPVPGVVLQLRGEAELKLESMTVKKRNAETNAGAATASISQGTVICSVQAREPVREAVFIKTSTDVWTANGGSLFTVGVAGDRTKAVCTAGIVQSLQTGQTVPAGNYYAGRPGSSREGENATDGEAQAETMKMLESSALLARLPPEQLTLGGLFPK